MKKDPLKVLADTVIALCEWHATEGNPKYTYWRGISGELRKAFPAKAREVQKELPKE